MTIVVDASLALAWCLTGEATPRTEGLLDRVVASDAVVPPFWSYEIANGLLVAERRGRQTEAETARFIELLEGLPIEPDLDAAGLAFSAVIGLARAHRLTTYDAAYLELSARRGLPIATNDDDLVAAALAAGVEVL